MIPHENIALAIGNAEPLWKQLTRNDEKNAILHCKQPYKAEAVPAWLPYGERAIAIEFGLIKFNIPRKIKIEIIKGKIK